MKLERVDIFGFKSFAERTELSFHEGVTAIVAGQSAGHNFTCAVVNGGVQCWGDNVNGQLGNNSTEDSLVPVQVEGLMEGVTALTAGSGHTCAVVNGGVQCWGRNFLGQLENEEDCLVPVQVGPTEGVTAIAAGWGHTCAVVNGGAQCWGSDSEGQLGSNATTAFSTVPVEVLLQ